MISFVMLISVLAGFFPSPNLTWPHCVDKKTFSHSYKKRTYKIFLTLAQQPGHTKLIHYSQSDMRLHVALPFYKFALITIMTAYKRAK